MMINRFLYAHFRFFLVFILSTLLISPLCARAEDLSITLVANKTNYLINQEMVYTLTLKNNLSTKIRISEIQGNFKTLETTAITGINTATFQSAKVSGTIIPATKSSDLGGSKLGNIEDKNELHVTMARIAAGETLIYTINALVADNLVKDITPNIVIKGTIKKNAFKLRNIKITTLPSSSNLTIIDYKLNSKTAYLINTERTLLLHIKNTGKGIAYEHHVLQNIATLKATLANSFDININNATDISANPFTTWQAVVSTIGAHSLSTLKNNPSHNIAFKDKVSVYPGEEITYAIKATLTPISIGAIKTIRAQIIGKTLAAISSKEIAAPLLAKSVLNSDSANIKITKTTAQAKYVPGGKIVYKILVKNTSEEYFANNIQLLDRLSCVKTKHSNTTHPESAFTSWTLEVVKGGDLQGTDPGKFKYAKKQTGDLNIMLDIAPSSEVEYKLTTTVSDTSIGTIVDNSPSCTDNITETGSGLQMPDYNLSVAKDVDLDKYTPGGRLVYSVTIINSGEGIAHNIRVVDALSGIMVKTYNGQPIRAYTSWEITASSSRLDGSKLTLADQDLAHQPKQVI